jgi:primosomal protein N'
MTISERKKEWKKIKENKSKIVIGPRSALFVPFTNIGLIIIDEEHDSSYSSFTTPKYITREVAEYIARDNNACLLLGSATPNVSTMYKAETGKIDYYTLTKRPANIQNPDIEIVDMKEVLQKELERLKTSGKISKYKGFDKPIRICFRLSEYKLLNKPFIYGLDSNSAKGIALTREEFKEYCKSAQL